MKILFINLPSSHGHINPTLPLVTALTKKGHHVDYLLSADFRKKVEYCGASLLPLNIEGSINKNKFTFFREAIYKINKAIDKIGNQYDLIFVGFLSFFVKKIEAQMSTPVIFCSATFLQNEYTLKHILEKTWTDPHIAKFFLAHYKHTTLFIRLLGLFIKLPFYLKNINPLNFFKPASSLLNIIFTSRYFQPEEETFDDKCLFIGPTPTIASMDQPFPIEKLENSNRPVIYATLGTVFNKWITFYKYVIKAFRNEDVLVVISTASKKTVQQLGQIPENFIVRDFVPQSQVLKHTDLFIAHGGMGSVSDGISLGVPMLMVPLGADQFFNSYRLKELGAGKVLMKKKLTPEILKKQAFSILKNQMFNIEIKKVQDSFLSSGGPEMAVRKIESLVAAAPVASLV